MSELSVRDHLNLEQMFIQSTKEQQDLLLGTMQKLLSMHSSTEQEMKRLAALLEEAAKQERLSKPSSLSKPPPLRSSSPKSKTSQVKGGFPDLMGGVFGFDPSTRLSIRCSKVPEPS